MQTINSYSNALPEKKKKKRIPELFYTTSSNKTLSLKDCCGVESLRYWHIIISAMTVGRWATWL